MGAQPLQALPTGSLGAIDLRASNLKCRLTWLPPPIESIGRILYIGVHL